MKRKNQQKKFHACFKRISKEEEFEHDREDPEQRFEEREIRKVTDHLYSLIYSVEYLQNRFKPVKELLNGRMDVMKSKALKITLRRQSP
ncbi:hypothetical protein CW734_16080 [Planococcus sp. MB-3u-03]|uniref:hypothetical protein n=1 Tax=Planococcus sp. MB-3u-03 TaxID=2058136 RepID=UPI000C3239E7|nr:hypothetical protein [Planococcus sp. MB-3u-03]AUD14909.1 hypothetical protein CW734_16080 [Planococcus sp. MB-3u-03]